MEETQNNVAQMDFSDKELEEQLLEAGNKLLDPPSSVEHILRLLNQVESCLLKVEQSPSKSMQVALSPSLNALIADKLLRHSDVDVKVAVASCISEITRITAPDAPYDDDQMKDVFRLIVSSFEDLHDNSSLSYKKRTTILETVAKVRSCVVMLDLECDALILEMFQHFLKTIREHHPESVFTSIESIMVLVLEESEDISLELLSPILASVKKDNEEVLPIARKLGERVLKSSAPRLKPYLVQAVNTLGISLDDYSDVVASICQDVSGNLEQNDACAASDREVDESKSAKEPVEESAQQVVTENANEATPQQDDPDGEGSPKSVMSNGIAQAVEDNVLAESKSPKKEDDNKASVLSKGNEETNDLVTENVVNKEQKVKQSTKRRGKKTGSLKLTVRSNLVSEKETEKKDDSKSDCKEIPSSPTEDSVTEAAGPSENGNEINAKIASPKAGDNESKAVVSPSPSENNHDEIHSKGQGRTKKKNSSVKDVAADVSKKVSEGTRDPEVKPTRPSAKKGPSHSSDVKTAVVVDAVKKGKGKTEEKIKGGIGSSSKQSEDKKKKGHGKGNSEKGLAKSSAKDEDEEMASPKTASKSTKDAHMEEAPKQLLDKKKKGQGKGNSEKGLAKTSAKDEDEEMASPKTATKSTKDEYMEETPKQSEGKKKKGQGKVNSEKVLAKSSAKDEDEEMASPETDSESTEDEDMEEAPKQSEDKKKKGQGKGNSEKGLAKSSAKDEDAETPKTNLKRKRTPGKEKESGIKKYDGSLIGKLVKVWWPDDEMYYEGVIESFDSSMKKHKVSYIDGDIEILNLRKEKWEIIDGNADPNEEEGIHQTSPGAAADMPPKKKGKANTGESKKEGKKDPSSKSSGGATSSKSKSVPVKSSQKSKTGGILEDEIGRKSKDHSLKSGGKSTDATQKNKSKNTDNSKISKSKEVSTPKESAKSKQETPKTGKSKQEKSKIASFSKTKSAKSAKSNTNVSGKMKSSLLKIKDSESEDSDDSEKEVEVAKVKTSSKAGSNAKSGKKRARN